jgi:lipid-binding SYLF domain-containing protein
MSAWFRSLSGVVALSVALGLAGCASPGPRAEAKLAHAVMHDAMRSLQDIDETGEHPGLRASMRDACAALVFPHLRGAGFFAGWAAGAGVLMVRDPQSGEWLGPTFLSLGDMAIGPEPPASEWQLVVVFRQCDALGPVRAGARTFSFRTALAGMAAERKGVAGPDIQAYARSEGATVGVALHFVELQADDALTQACYGRSLSTGQALDPRLAVDADVQTMRKSMAWAAR